MPTGAVAARRVAACPFTAASFPPPPPPLPPRPPRPRPPRPASSPLWDAPAPDGGRGGVAPFAEGARTVSPAPPPLAADAAAPAPRPPAPEPPSMPRAPRAPPPRDRRSARQPSAAPLAAVAGCGACAGGGHGPCGTGETPLDEAARDGRAKMRPPRRFRLAIAPAPQAAPAILACIRNPVGPRAPRSLCAVRVKAGTSGVRGIALQAARAEQRPGPR